MKPLTIFASLMVLTVGTTVIGCQALLSPDDPLLPFETRDVVLAVDDIAQGSVIKANLIAIRSVVIDDTNSMAYSDLSDVVGRTAAIDILGLQMMAPNLIVECGRASPRPAPSRSCRPC